MKAEILDVIIIGAGLSGIGAAVHLQRNCPGKTFAVLESRAAMGGTWDLFRYPGIRSDSDMFTLAYNFKPWTNPKTIADGPSIRNYIRDIAVEYGIDRNIRYQHKVIAMDWSSRRARWTLTVQKADSSETFTLESRFVICCAGYYKYESGYTPEFAGREDFTGHVIHPQLWPENFDYSGKRVVVIGSGATAVTLVPALAEKAAHVTMLQRSPGYVVSLPEQDAISNNLRKVLPERTVYALARTRNVLIQAGMYHFSRKFPAAARKLLLAQVEQQVGPQVDMANFSPVYNVWDERLCAVPDGDLFNILRQGRASVMTDNIACFTANGILLKSGKTLACDVIVTATGLRVQLLGGIVLTLDGQLVLTQEKLYYKGAMLEDVPNFSMVFGYTNSSWTLKADLIAEYTCRVLRYMDTHGYAQCTPRNHEGNVSTEPFLNMTAGYIQRVLALLPKQGAQEPWKVYQNYLRDYAMLKLGRVDDRAMVFSNPIAHDYGYEAVTRSASVPLVAAAIH